MENERDPRAELAMALRRELAPLAARLTPHRLLACVIGCFAVLLGVGLAYGHPEVILLGVAAWFAARLLR